MTEKSIAPAEGWAVLACCVTASIVAIVWSCRHSAMLNYGDAIGHLHIARRVFDSRTPRISQLGSVWLPLPHILLIPFVQNYKWWATGFAGVIPSALAYVVACAGFYRLARRWLSPAAAALALAFFALNPNLLYLQTTAMTEPLFLCEMVWIVVWLVEWRLCLDQGSECSANSANRLQVCIAAALVAAIFTRYDGWIIALLAWTGIGLTLLKRAAAGERSRLFSPSFWLASITVIVAPILWFAYNSVCFGDWLYFARGPFSAKAIELRTSPPGAWPLHPGWHNLWVAFLFYIKVSLLDSIAAHGNEVPNLILALAALATIAAGITQKSRASRRAFAWVLLLWLPIPFYTWSVAYGSVPIFFPAWWPHTWYNTRYGIELLPALALGLGFVAQSAVHLLHRLTLSRSAPHLKNSSRATQSLAGIAFAAFFALVALNLVQLFRQHPLVYTEGTRNLQARLPYDTAIPPFLQKLLLAGPLDPVLMDTSIYPEIVAFTGIPLRQTINESDLGIFRAALAAPSTHAAIVVAFDGDAIDEAVKAHPTDLQIVGRFTAKDQPTATVYRSSWWVAQNPLAQPQQPAAIENSSK